MNILTRSSLNLTSKKRCSCFSVGILQSRSSRFVIRYSLCFDHRYPFSQGVNSHMRLNVASEFKRF